MFVHDYHSTYRTEIDKFSRIFISMHVRNLQHIGVSGIEMIGRVASSGSKNEKMWRLLFISYLNFGYGVQWEADGASSKISSFILFQDANF